MSTISIQKATQQEKTTLPVFAEIHKRFEDVQRRAQDLFRLRGGENGKDLEDWLRAERDILGESKAELCETDHAYEVEVALPGFEAKDVEVTATEDEIAIHAAAERRDEKKDGKKVVWTEFGSREVYRCFHLPRNTDTGKITAKLDKGLLRIHAPRAAEAKTAAPAKKIDVVAA